MARLEDVVAEEVVVLRQDGVDRALTVRIGRPYLWQEDSWKCPCEIEGLDRRVDLAGVGSLHALSVALKFAKTRLQHQLDGGGSLHYAASGSVMDLELLFGR